MSDSGMPTSAEPSQVRTADSATVPAHGSLASRNQRIEDPAPTTPFASLRTLTPPMPLPRCFTPHDRSDYLFFAALLALPMDGTVLGFFQPFWTPLSPWLLVLYCLANPRLLRQTLHRYAPFMMLSVVLVVLSMPGWAAFGLHNNAVVMSLTGVIAVPATLCALDIAYVHKRLSWQESVRAIIAVYWFAFAIGIVQWLSITLRLGSVQGYFSHLMYRSYIIAGSAWGMSGARPQFLFAEPSYIGMHLFGILLPLFWFMRIRDRIFASRLRHLIIVFAVGSVLMGSGTRIVLDSLVALIAVIVMETHWRNRNDRRTGVLQLIGTLALAVVCVMANSRLDSILHNGMEGDGSFFARIWQSLAPLCGLVRHPWALLTGYGAGNIAEATHNGADWSAAILRFVHTDPTGALSWYRSINADTVWTMSAYTNFLTEFGLIGFALFLTIAFGFIHRYHRWNKLTIVWLLLVMYLYVQFEGYAFAAIPLMIWALTRLDEFIHVDDAIE
ncbi:hypothetical protein BW14_11300 [Bifidobacterium sp. UTBIF-68]|nr:hypothetical protein BW14_11300 [Bifidobacterium sp. UTBIF-68]